MNDDFSTFFHLASDRFREQVRGGFGQGLAADILDPLERELADLAAELETTKSEISDIENQLNENNP